MEKSTSQVKDPSGDKLYLYDNNIVKSLPFFLYEVKMYKYWDLGFCELGSKMFRSDKLLDIKCYNKVRYVDNYTIEEEIILIGVPEQFIKEKGLQEYHPTKNKKSKKK